MSYFYCDCNFCKSNNYNKKIYWKKIGFNIKNSKLNSVNNITWKRSSLISWRGYIDDKLILLYYIYTGYYIKDNFNINSKKVPYLHIFVMEVSFFIWKVLFNK
jgi:hypothetical protein